MMKLQFEKYDRLLDEFDSFNTDLIWPSPEEIELLEKLPEKHAVLYACYLYEKGIVKTTSDKYSKKNLQEFINSHLELI